MRIVARLRHKPGGTDTKLFKYVKQVERFRDSYYQPEDIDDVVGREMTPVPAEPTRETDAEIEVRPWYRCGVESIKTSFGTVHFAAPYKASPEEMEIIKAARQRVIDEIARGYEQREQERASLRAELIKQREQEFESWRLRRLGEYSKRKGGLI